MKNKFSKWDVGGGSRSIVQGLNLFTSRNLFKSLKSILMVVALLSLSSNVWGATASLTNEEIKAATAGNSYANRSVTSASGTWAGKMIINTATGFVQINKNSSNYYLGSPTFSGSVTKVVINTCNSTASGRTFYLCANTNTAQPTSGDYGSGSTSSQNGSATINVTGSPKQFYIYTSGAAYISSVEVTYGASTPTTITYHVGSASGTVQTTVGASLATAMTGISTTSCDANSTTFVGWSTAPIDGKVQTAPSSLLASDATVTANMEIWAVWAKAVDNSSTLTLNASNLESAMGTSYLSTDFTYLGLTFGRSNAGVMSSGIQIKANTSNCVYNKTALSGSITKIVVTGKTNNSTLTVGTSQSPTTNSASCGTSTTTKEYEASSNYKYFKIAATSSYTVVTSIVITYGSTTYSDYLTTCGPSTYTVSFVAGSNGSVSSPSIADLSGEQTITINGNKLTIGSTTITANPNLGYKFNNWTKGGSVVTNGQKVSEACTITANFVVIPKLTTPTGLSVSNITSSGATLSWNAVTNATSYVIILIGDDSHNDPINVGNTNTYNLTDLTASTDYLWTVKAIGDGSNYLDSDESETEEFTTLGASTKTIYLEPNVWDITSAKFFVHAWGGGDADVEMATAVNCESKILQADVPLETTNVIFTRQDKGTSSLTWNWDQGLWNKSKEVSLGTNNYVKITTYESGSWDDNHQLSGTETKSYSGPNWSVRGTFNGENYGTAHTMVKGDGCDGTVSLTLAANTTYYFKVVNETLGYWYGCTPNPTPTASFSNYDFVQGENNNCPFTTTVAGIYTFAVDYSNSDAPKVSVTYPIKYTVTYDGNGNTSGSAPAAVDYAKGATVTVAGNTGSLAKTGYDFGGWNTKNDGTGTNYTAGSGTFTINANTALYAKWTIKNYVVTKGTVTGGSATVPSSVNHGGDVTLTGLTPDANHKLPYTITVTGNYGSIDDATIKNVTGAITVNVSFAEKAQYTVTFKNNGTQTSTESVVEGGKVSSLPTLAASQAPISGYTFIGWVNHSYVWSGFEAEMTQALITGNEVINADVTYDAVWAKATNNYEVVREAAGLTAGNYVIDGYDDDDETEEAMDNTFAGKTFPTEDHGVISTTDNSIIWNVTIKNGLYALKNLSTNTYFNFTSTYDLTLSSSPVYLTISGEVVDELYEVDLNSGSKHLEYDNNAFDSWTSAYNTIYFYKQKINNYFVTPPAQVTVTWHIGNGTQTATTYDGTAFSELTAPEVDDDAIGDCVNKFMGWATVAITKDEATKEDVAWADETTISNSNKDFYAVFANAEGSGDYTLVSGASQLGEGEAYIGSYINYSGWNYYVATGAGDITKTTLSENVLTPTEAMLKLTLVSTGTANQYYLKDASGKYLHASSTGVNPTLSETACAWTFSGESSLMGMKSSLGSNVYLCAYSSGTTGKLKTYSTESGNAKICVYLSSVTYSNYATSCPDLKYATITFDANGKTLASGSMPADMTNAVVGRANTLPSCEATVTGYTFAGWSATSSGSVITEYTPAAEGQTYRMYAIWQVNSHTLTWALNGGTAGTGTITPAGSVAYGTVLQYTVDPTRDGKKFNGWSPEMISGTTTMPDNDQTYTAQWRDIVWTDYLTDCGTLYDITLVGGGTKTGGTFSASAGSAIGGSTVTLMATPDGCYNFTGWSVYSESGTEETVTDNTFTMPEYDVTVDATFTQKTNKISYNTNGGSHATETYEDIYVGCGEEWIAPVDPVKAGYTFQGWLGEESATRYKQGDGFIPTQAQTMTAQWTANPYVWTLYNNQSGEWTDAAIDNVTSGSVVFNFTEKEQQFSFKIRKTNDGVNYTYYGASDEDNEYTYAKSLDDEHKYWTLNGNAGGYDVNVTTAAKGTYTIHISMDGDNPRIYIEYPTPYTIHFDGKGADYGSMADIVNIASGENVVLPANGFTKTNNAFVGWDTNSAGTNVVYGNQATINNVSADITLYAVWVSARYTITLDANGGTVSPDKVQQAVVGGTVALPTPTKDGYAFDGWYTEREGGSKITEAYPIPLADATYYAHWTSLETSWYVKGDFDWSTGVQFVKMPGQSSDVAFAIVEWNSDDNMNFKIYDLAEDKWYGNAGTMTRTNCTGWNVWNDNDNNTKLDPTGHGHYIFKLDLSGEYPAISVSYPNWNYDSHNSTAGTTGQDYFTYVNPLDWKYEGFILPTINNESDEGKQIWIGDGAWNNNYSDNWWYRWIKLNQYADETVGHGVDGAVGTLHINPFSGSKNYGLRFDPAGYGMKYGSGSGVSYMTGGYAFTQKTNDPAVWNTQAIENIEDLQGKQFYVGLATATEGEYKFSYDYVGECNGLSAIANINDIKVWTEANPDRWGDATVGSLSNTRGHFQIWADNASQKNFYIHWIPDNKMTFDLGDAEGHIAAIDPMYRGRDLSGSEATITLPEPADWISHTFGGWVINGVQHDAGDEILLNEDMTAVAQWTTNYYTITYTGISAYSTTCDGSTLVLCGTAQTVCIPIEATGYEFSGWTSNVEIGGETEFVGGENFTMPCEDVTFTGSYTPIVYSITYEGLEGASNPNPTNYTIETPTITLQDPGARAGYNFSHWTCNDATITTIPQGSTGDMTIVAIWNAKQTNITLNHEGSATGSDNVVATYDAAMPTITIPSMAGYTFNGYFDAAKSGTKYYDAAGASVRNWDKEEASATLYAQWTALEVHYTVNHYKQQLNGSYSSTPDKTEDLTALAGATRTPARSDWVGFTAPDGQQVTIAGDGSTVVNYQYTRNKYTLTWVLDGGTPVGDYTEGGDVYYEAPITYPTTVEKGGYCFKGWTYSTGKTQPPTMPHEALTITAQWAAYTNYRTYCGDAVTFYAQNGTEPEEEYVITTDNNKITTPTLSQTGFTQPEGWVLIGWTKVGDDTHAIVELGKTNVVVADGDEYNAVWTHITITGNVLTTSAVGVQVGTTIHVEGTTNNAYGLRVSFVDTKGTDDTSDDVTYQGSTGETSVTKSDFRLASTSYTYIDDNIIRIEGTAAGDTHSSDYNVVYTPKTANEIDNYVLKIQVMQTSQTALDGALYTLNLKGRALTDNFVIAEYLNDKWYALPADMNGSNTYAGKEITVEGEGKNRVVTNATLDMVYSMKTYNFDRTHVLFQSQFNQGHLWAATGNETGINDYAKTVTGNSPAYSWMPTPQNETLDTYVMSNANNNKNLVLNNSNTFGMYAKASNNTNIVYFIPLKAEEYVEKEMMMVEWFPTKVLVEVEDALTDVRAKVNNVQVAGVTANDTKYGAHQYEITGLNTLVENAAKKLTILYTKEETTYGYEFDIPVIMSNKTYSISGGTTFPWTQAVYNTADLVVRDGSVLTVNGATTAANTFGNVTIYPTSKVIVPAQTAGDNATDITMTTTTMTLFGGTDEIYNGSEYTLTKYGVPQLVLNGKLVHNETTRGLVYDVRLDATQYYNFALPYTSKYELVTDNKGGEDFTFWTKVYDGATRAAGNNGWVWYNWDADPWAINIGTGYMFAAQPYGGQNYIIIRHPMGYDATENADGHRTSTAEATNAAVNVYAYPSTYPNNAGWNYIANPFMANFTKDLGDGCTGIIQTGQLVEHKVNEKWDGHYEWEAGSLSVRYVTLYDNGTDTYEQLPMSTAVLAPFTGFFVQMAETGQIVFDISGRTNSAPARMLSEDELPSEMEIFLHATCQGQKDDAVLYINDNLRRDNAKEFPNEMTKQENANTLNFYTFGGDDIKMYANGMSYEDAQGWSKAGVKVAAAGEYTFSVASDQADYIQQVILRDMDSNTEYDLMSNDAKIYLDKGEMNDRFYVKIVFGKHNIGTGITERYDTSAPEKFILNDHMYIRANGVLFDGVGKRVK